MQLQLYRVALMYRITIPTAQLGFKTERDYFFASLNYCLTLDMEA